MIMGMKLCRKCGKVKPIADIGLLKHLSFHLPK